MPLPIGFFAPLPLPVMIPFMAMQSFAMMYAAGTGWQYGKRKISSMTNETFNPLTPVQLNATVLGSIHEMIPSFQQSSQQMSEMNKIIFEEMRKMISDATSFFGDLVMGMFQGIGKNFMDYFSGLNLGEQMPLQTFQASPGPEIKLIEDVETNLFVAETLDTTTQEKLQKQKEDDFFKITMSNASDSTIIQAKAKLYGFRNTQKSIIVAEWNKRGLNPKNPKVEQVPEQTTVKIKTYSSMVRGTHKSKLPGAGQVIKMLTTTIRKMHGAARQSNIKRGGASLSGSPVSGGNGAYIIYYFDVYRSNYTEGQEVHFVIPDGY